MCTGILYVRTGILYVRTGILYVRTGILYVRTGILYVCTGILYVCTCVIIIFPEHNFTDGTIIILYLIFQFVVLLIRNCWTITSKICSWLGG